MGFDLRGPQKALVLEMFEGWWSGDLAERKPSLLN
jgi:hypothetical protein